MVYTSYFSFPTKKLTPECTYTAIASHCPCSIARVTVLGLSVCVSLSAPFRPLRVKVSPENDTNSSSRQDKENKTAIFLKMLRSKVMASFAHFVGVRRSCRALQFILTATETAIATQKPNGKLNTAC